jgi:hypothetical protein
MPMASFLRNFRANIGISGGNSFIPANTSLGGRKWGSS